MRDLVKSSFNDLHILLNLTLTELLFFNLDRFQDIVSLFHEPHFRLSVSLLYLFQFQHMSPLGIGQRVWSTSHSVMLESVKGVMLLEPGNEVDVTYAAHQ
jgi:hypothetical protein